MFLERPAEDFSAGEGAGGIANWPSSVKLEIGRALSMVDMMYVLMLFFIIFYVFIFLTAAPLKVRK